MKQKLLVVLAVLVLVAVLALVVPEVVQAGWAWDDRPWP